MKRKIVFLTMLFSLDVDAGGYLNDEGGVKYTAGEVRLCFDFGDVGEINKCVNFFYEDSNGELRRALSRIQGGIKKDMGIFKDSQSKWEAYRDSQCEVESVGGRVYRDPVSQREVLFKACTSTINNARAKQLNSMQLNCASCIE